MIEKEIAAAAGAAPVAIGTEDTDHLRTPRIIGLAGWSGSGKTTLISRLIPLLTARGVTVSTIKHAHHAFDVDKPGKDSYEHRNAGAMEVLVASENRWALMHELRGAREPSLQEFLAKLAPVDLVTVVAVASDGPVAPPPTISTFALDDIHAIADFVLMRAAPAPRFEDTSVRTEAA